MLRGGSLNEFFRLSRSLFRDLIIAESAMRAPLLQSNRHHDYIDISVRLNFYVPNFRSEVTRELARERDVANEQSLEF